MARECGDCTKCCEGWVSSVDKKIEFYPGKPCHFLKGKNICNGCTIYEDRPKMCKDFECEWLINENIPEWFKPSISNTILMRKKQYGFEYYELIEAGARMDPIVLSWVLTHCVNNKYNIRYIVDGGVYKIGSNDFWTSDKLS